MFVSALVGAEFKFVSALVRAASVFVSTLGRVEYVVGPGGPSSIYV